MSLKYCLLPFKNLFIGTNGFAKPCCFIGASGTDFAYLKNNTIEECWNSEAFIKVRNEVIDNNFNICKGCKCSVYNKNITLNDIPDRYKGLILNKQTNIDI